MTERSDSTIFSDGDIYPKRETKSELIGVFSLLKENNATGKCVLQGY